MRTDFKKHVTKFHRRMGEDFRQERAGLQIKKGTGILSVFDENSDPMMRGRGTANDGELRLQTCEFDDVKLDDVFIEDDDGEQWTVRSFLKDKQAEIVCQVKRVIEHKRGHV